MERDVKIEQDIIDMLIERPISFKIEQRRFNLYPPTLGKMYVVSSLLEKASLTSDYILSNPYEASLSYVITYPEDACRVLSYYTLRKYEEIFDVELVDERAEYFREHLDVGELTQLLVLALQKEDVATFIKYLHIDREKESMQKVLDCKKKENNNYSFGGLSVYGSLVDVLCERYHWTLDYLLWGISFANVKMLLDDKVTSIYLTDEEKKKCRVSQDRNVVNGDDINCVEYIKQMMM